VIDLEVRKIGGDSYIAGRIRHLEWRVFPQNLISPKSDGKNKGIEHRRPKWQSTNRNCFCSLQEVSSTKAALAEKQQDNWPI
jgi:hypothetical protein